MCFFSPSGDPFILPKGTSGWRDKASCSRRPCYSFFIQERLSFQGITRHNAFCDTSNKNTQAATLAQKKRPKSNHLELFLQKQPHVDMQESNSKPSIYRTLPPSTASFSHHFWVRAFLSLLWFYPFSSCHEVSSSRESSSLPRSRKYSGEHEHLCKLQNPLQQVLHVLPTTWRQTFRYLFGIWLPLASFDGF